MILVLNRILRHLMDSVYACVWVVRTYVNMCESVCGASTRVDHHSETDHKLVTAHAAMLLCWVHDSEGV